MPTQRQRRVGQLLQEEISRIIREDMQDPHVGFVTVTEVEVSVDLRHAQVYVSVLGDETTRQETMATFSGKAARFIRGQLADSVALKYIPELHFRVDDSARQAGHIEMLLTQLARQRGNATNVGLASSHEGQPSDD